MKQIDLRELERKAFTSYHQDGLLDIGIGVFILSFGIGMLTEMFWLPAIAISVAMSVWYAAKKTVTAPRVGCVKFGPERYSHLRNLMTVGVIVLSLCVLVSLVVFYGSATGNIPSWVKLILIDHGDTLIGVIGSGLFLVVGYSLNIGRLYAYTILTLGIFILSDALDIGFTTGALILGSSVTLGGVVVLIQFMHKNPVVRGDPLE